MQIQTPTFIRTPTHSGKIHIGELARKLADLAETRGGCRIVSWKRVRSSYLARVLETIVRRN